MYLDHRKFSSETMKICEENLKCRVNFTHFDLYIEQNTRVNAKQNIILKLM